MDWAELTNWPEYAKLLVGLFAMANPLTDAPIFLSLTSSFTPDQRRHTANLVFLGFVGVLLVTLLVGPALLSFFGITVPAFRVAGGVLLLLLGLDMARKDPAPQEGTQAASPSLVAFVPLTVPLTAGPGAITTVILYGQGHTGSWEHRLLVGGVILTLGLGLWLTLRSAEKMSAFLSETGMQVFQRLLGLLVAAVGVEFILDGVALHFPDLFQFHGHEE